MEQIMATDAMSEFFKEGDRRTDGRTRLMFHFCAAPPHAFETGPARRRHPGKRWKTDRQQAEDDSLLFQLLMTAVNEILEDECGSLVRSSRV